MEDFKLVINPGKDEDRYPIFCAIIFTEGKLSISGVVGPTRNGNAEGSCGQINPVQVEEFNKHWTPEKLQKFNKIWDEHHLNNMNTGTLEQDNFIREMKKTGWKYEYVEACDFLKAKDLYEVPHPVCEGLSYRYGDAWSFREIPEEVLQFLKDLPETEVIPAWV